MVKLTTQDLRIAGIAQIICLRKVGVVVKQLLGDNGGEVILRYNVLGEGGIVRKQTDNCSCPHAQDSPCCRMPLRTLTKFLSGEKILQMCELF